MVNGWLVDGLWWFLWVYLTVKSLRYAILTYICRKQHEIRTNLTHKRDQKNFHSDRELEGLELNLRNSHNQSRARTAGQMASCFVTWRKTRIVAKQSSAADTTNNWSCIHCRFSVQ